MKEKVKVHSKWKYRLFLIQILSVFITIILLFGKLFGIGVSWIGCFYPVLISIGIPLALGIVGIVCAFILFGILYLFAKKDNKKKLKDAFGKVKWKR